MLGPNNFQRRYAGWAALASKKNGMGRGALTRVVGFWNSILDVFWADDSHYGG